ncbi:MAG: ABC transporter permease [Polyangiaceae bacterium]|nr:ABC transporter permease [Polyangiaceae bacterium]
MNFFHQLLGNRKAVIGLWVMAAFALTALIGPWLVRDPADFLADPLLPPNSEYWLGTTRQGQDVFAQTICGARMSLLIGFFVGVVVVFIGATVGIAAGFFGGWVDDALSLLTNVFLIIPGLPLAVVLAAYLEASPLSIAFVLILTGWAWNARVVRAQTLSIAKKDFVSAALTSGESKWRIMFWEILPNMTSLVVSGFIGAVVYAIGAQVGLEFLGMGDVSEVTWGTNLFWAANNQALLTESWWTIVPTGVSVALVGFALVMINFAIDEVTNPKLKSEADFRKVVLAEGVEPGFSTPVLKALGERTQPTRASLRPAPLDAPITPVLAAPPAVSNPPPPTAEQVADTPRQPSIKPKEEA